ncbi:tyrosine-type recombinase/integrase [Bacillus mycoides]|uniref:tyrosine-type recombinase/integrase n=1 Tax=Bacillus mycoides TaxID=1405 RepID=UPI003D231DED
MKFVIRDLVQQLCTKYNTNNPYELADCLKINVLTWDLHEEINGFYKYEKRNRYIVINNHLSPSMQRTVCAHELGHAILHTHANTPFLRKNTFFSVDKLEIEANTFAALLNTGMRKGEAAALQWKDINLKEHTITISKTLDFTAKTKEELFGDTKTFTSKRTIMIPKSLVDELLEHKKWQNANKLVLQDAYEHELDLVFSRVDGKFLPKSTLFNAFSRILKKANLPRLEIHSLRHTHAVLLLESGASMKYIQDRLGHKSIEITANVYSHISDKINKDSISGFEAYMNNVLG